jgi:hypothetical protein
MTVEPQSRKRPPGRRNLGGLESLGDRASSFDSSLADDRRPRFLFIIDVSELLSVHVCDNEGSADVFDDQGMGKRRKESMSIN